MPTTAETVRRGLKLITDAAKADLSTVTAAASSPTEVRAALFAAAPLIVGDYTDAAATLALDWYEEIRSAARPRHLFTPVPHIKVTDDDVKAMIAVVTADLQNIEAQIEADMQAIMDQVAAEVQKDVAAGFWDTTTGNTDLDPDATGWQRFTKPGACKFCVMLAGRGSVYTESSVHFAAHTDCHCVVGPSFDPHAPKADVMQYIASKRQRTEKERAALREYLNHNFPDAPG